MILRVVGLLFLSVLSLQSDDVADERDMTLMIIFVLI